MFLVSSCSCLCPVYWSHLSSWEWRCSWSSADRRCSNYIWVINNLIAHQCAPYIRELTVDSELIIDILSGMGCLLWVLGENQSLPLLWRHNGRDSVSNHQSHDCLLNRLFRRRSKKTSKLRVTGLCAGNSPGTGEFPHKGPVTRKMFPFDDVIMAFTLHRDPLPITDIRASHHTAYRLQRHLGVRNHNRVWAGVYFRWWSPREECNLSGNRKLEWWRNRLWT